MKSVIGVRTDAKTQFARMSAYRHAACIGYHIESYRCLVWPWSVFALDVVLHTTEVQQIVLRRHQPAGAASHLARPLAGRRTRVTRAVPADGGPSGTGRPVRHRRVLHHRQGWVAFQSAQATRSYVVFVVVVSQLCCRRLGCEIHCPARHKWLPCCRYCFRISAASTVARYTALMSCGQLHTMHEA
jgi:hypothetical protein